MQQRVALRPRKPPFHEDGDYRQLAAHAARVERVGIVSGRIGEGHV